MPQKKQPSAEPARLDLGYVALFVGLRVNELAAEHLEAEGFEGLRHAHGYVFQHLLSGPLAVTELARLLGVSQQAASKTIAELAVHGYVEDAASADARVRLVALSSRSRDAIAATRDFRRKFERRLKAKYAAEAEQARALLARVLADLGGAEAVRTRKVRAPR